MLSLPFFTSHLLERDSDRPEADMRDGVATAGHGEANRPSGFDGIKHRPQGGLNGVFHVLGLRPYRACRAFDAFPDVLRVWVPGSGRNRARRTVRDAQPHYRAELPDAEEVGPVWHPRAWLNACPGLAHPKGESFEPGAATGVADLTARVPACLNRPHAPATSGVPASHAVCNGNSAGRALAAVHHLGSWTA